MLPGFAFYSRLFGVKGIRSFGITLLFQQFKLFLTSFLYTQEEYALPEEADLI